MTADKGVYAMARAFESIGAFRVLMKESCNKDSR